MKLPPSKGLGIPQECVLERRVRGVLLGVSSWCDCALCAVSSDVARCGGCFCSHVRMRAGNALSPAPSYKIYPSKRQPLIQRLTSNSANGPPPPSPKNPDLFFENPAF